jgi:hypothetical protein
MDKGGKIYYYFCPIASSLFKIDTPKGVADGE